MRDTGFLRPTFPAILIALAGAVPASAKPRITIVLAPISAETVNHCDPEDLEAALKSGLRRGKRFRLAAVTGSETLRLELLECSHFDAGSRFIEVASDPDDPDLEKAVAAIRRAIDKALAHRSGWLVGGREKAH